MVLLLLYVLLAMTAVMGVGWAVQRAANNGGWTDVFWTYGTGAVCAAAALASPGVMWRRGLVAAMLVVWALRLGTYVALRVARSREDVRYSLLRQEWGPGFQRNMFGLLIAQAPITTVVCVGMLFAASAPEAAFRLRDLAAVLIMAVAIGGETLADRQMTAFKADPANQGKVCDRGLWGWSRHPNYFFEAVVWWAYPVMGLDLARPWSLASLLAPAVMFAIVRYGTGIPPLEAAMVTSKGEAYRRYQARVSPLLPRPPKSV